MRSIKNIAVYNLLLISIAALAACGGGGGGGGGGGASSGGGVDGDSLRVNIEGRAVKGVMKDPDVQIFLIKDGVALERAEYSADSDKLGNFSFHSPIYTAPPFSAMLKTETGLKFYHKCDFYPSCNDVDFGEIDTLFGNSIFSYDVTGMELRSYIPALASDNLVNANVSTLTSFAVAMAEGMPGKLTDENASKAKKAIEDLFGLTERDIDIQATKLIDLTDVNEWVSATEEERYHSVMNAAIVGMPEEVFALQRESLGVDPAKNDYQITFNNVLSDLAFNGQFGGDDRYKEDFIQLFINIDDGAHSVSLSGYIGARGEVKLSHFSDIYDQVTGYIRLEGMTTELLYKSSYRQRFYAETGFPVWDSGVLTFTVSENGAISGISEGSNSSDGLSGVVTGDVLRVNKDGNQFNTNSGFDIEKYKDIANKQLALLHAHYGTTP